MKKNSNISYIFKTIAIALALAVLAPYGIKLNHTFTHHNHEVCHDDGDENNTHFHTSDLDCDFYKFKLNTNYYATTLYDFVPEVAFLSEESTSHYFFLRAHFQHTSFLRGPPLFV